MLLRQGTRTDYNYKEYVLDTKDDLDTIDKDECCAGSMAYIIETKEFYILNNKKEWVSQ
jgi:hypothetical protein